MELQGTLQMTAGGITLDNYMLLLLAIMVVTGVLGGVANYFMREKDPNVSAKDLVKYAVLGIVAALTVPLFLNMISSDLLAGAKSRPIELFVFAGFCLLFVLFSRRFVEGAAAKLLQHLDHIRR
jgi:RsiW-degrading membrane proteinase PrsW (M82 family)